MDINWSKIILSEKFFSRLESMVRRSIVDEVIADEAITYIIHTLSDNDWEKCRAFSGKSAPETFLYSLSSNLIVDYSRKIYGRQRPPSWLKQKGDLWVAIWKELCLDRQVADVIVNRHSLSGFRDALSISAIITTIKAKLPWCGVSVRPESLDDEEQSIIHAELVTEHEDFQQQVAAEQALQFAHMLLNGLEAETINALEPGKAQAVVDAIKAIELAPQDLLLLKMYFCEGMSGAAIAVALDMPKHQPVRQIQKILEKARTHMIDIDLY